MADSNSSVFVCVNPFQQFIEIELYSFPEAPLRGDKFSATSVNPLLVAGKIDNKRADVCNILIQQRIVSGYHCREMESRGGREVGKV